MDALFAVLIGAVGGLLGGVLGVGGGVIMVPGLVLLVDLDQHTAQGLALGSMVITALLGSFLQLREGNLQPPLVLWMAPAAVLFGVLGGYVAGLIDAPQLSRIFGAFMVLMALRLLWSAPRVRVAEVMRKETPIGGA